MNFTISQSTLAQVLPICSSISDKKNIMPILSSVKFVAENDVVKIYSTDLEISLYAEVQANVTKNGTVAVDAKKLAEGISTIKEGVIEFNLINESHLEISSGESLFKLNTTSVLAFPNLTGINIKSSINVDSKKLLEMFAKTGFSICSDETRYNINGLYVETINDIFGKKKNGIRFVTTDGHRISIIDRPSDGITLDKGILIPKKGVVEMMRFLTNLDASEVKMSIEDEFFAIKNDFLTLSVRLSTGVFPNYRQVLPQETTTTIKLSSVALSNALKQVSIMTSELTKSVVFNLNDGALELSASNKDYGDANAKITNVSHSGDNLTTGFSAKYLLELLQHFQDKDEEVVINLNSKSGPGSFSFKSDEHYSCVIMPMRIQEEPISNAA